MSRSSRATTVRKSPAERSAEIVDAAVALARREGLSAVKLRSVAAAAAVAPGLVAHYVPSMDALVATAFERITRAELEEVREIVLAASTPAGSLAELLATVFDGEREDVSLVWVEAWTLGRANEALAASVREVMDAWHATLSDIVAAGAESGDFRVTAPNEAAWHLLGLIDGLSAQTLVHWRPASRPAVLGELVERVLGARPGALATLTPD
ncbi:TetR family transcriptional regulator C-terminal domain-containing protein [Zhihengliuella sp.]|uniref:TetR/AcrR family transcriptional regulator n=1 Tax=Zhihengliuella sp. TaxID=1954483 RepID=UPI002810BD33|nr:TetR family transcriptional regulator C-terminal domain-containing protein [Zhihengliuella sp.]